MIDNNYSCDDHAYYGADPCPECDKAWSGLTPEPVTPTEKMTQLDRALRALATLQPTGPELAAAKVLSDIVDEAQNSPPDGGSDGSIGVTQWYAMRLVTVTFANFHEAVAAALGVQK